MPVAVCEVGRGRVGRGRCRRHLALGHRQLLDLALERVEQVEAAGSGWEGSWTGRLTPAAAADSDLPQPAATVVLQGLTRGDGGVTVCLRLHTERDGAETSQRRLS